MKSIEKNEPYYCRSKNKDVNLHTQTHPITKRKYSIVCDDQSKECPQDCKYYTSLDE